MSALVTHLVPVIGLHTHASQSDHSWVTCTLGSSSCPGSHSRCCLRASAGRPPGGSRSGRHPSPVLLTADPPVREDRASWRSEVRGAGFTS